jgi:hypothetical protein
MFNPANLVHVTSYSTGNSVVAEFSYTTTGTLSQIGSAYFQDAVPTVRVGDLVKVKASDGTELRLMTGAISNPETITGYISLGVGPTGW